MDSLKQYLEIQRIENENVREEISTKLEELLQPLDIPMSTSKKSPTKYSNYISELCQFEQKINHKLTEINYELKKFKMHNKYPVYVPPPIENPTSDDSFDDIETLKANSSRLISKLNRLGMKQEEMDTKIVYNDQNEDSLIDFECKFREILDQITITESESNELDEDIRCQKQLDNFDIAPSLNERKILETCVPKPEVDVKREYDLNSELIDLEEHKHMEIIENTSDSKPEDVVVKTEAAGSDILQIMWKNVMELGSTSYKDREVPEIPMENNRAENKINDDKSESESAKSSDYSSESDSGVLPGTDSTQKIGEENLVGGLEEKRNLCDTTKKNFLELLKANNNINCTVEKFMEIDGLEDIKDSLEMDSNNCKKKEAISEPEPESSKPSFSAEEKIRKLGLEDRQTLFEKTRKCAVLPDLRLRPDESSVSDTEKLKQIKKNKNTFEITESIVPSLNMGCVFSHVESPSEFYLHLDTEESKLIDSLNDLITEKYRKTKTPYCSKVEASEDIGRFCCAYVKDDKMYYRVEVVDWIFGKADKLVLVQLVDYGNHVYVHYKNLRPLTAEFCVLPKLAVRCYFPLLYPRGSVKNHLLTEWPRSSTEALFELSGLSMEHRKAFFKISYVEAESNEVGIEMYQADGGRPNMIGQLLIDLGHAVQIILPQDDPMGIMIDEEEIKNLEKCDNINEVILGYDPKDEARICKLTKHDGGRCFKRTCKLEHAKFSRGGFTTDRTLTYAEAINDLRMPKLDDLIAIRFTTFLEATRFYVNLHCFVEDLRHLELIMNDPVNVSNFERYKILPAHGEIVLVKHWHKRWLRAKVRHHLFNEDGKCTVQVFMVDYGDVIDVGLDNIRKIKTEHLTLPFQAVECMLNQYKDSKQCSEKVMNRFFYENMAYRNFSAKVKAVGDMQLCLDIFFKDKNLGDILVDYGFLMKVEEQIIFPHTKSMIIPG